MSTIMQDYQYLTEICQSCDEKNDPDEFYISHSIDCLSQKKCRVPCQVTGKYPTIRFTKHNMLFTVFVITITEHKCS